MTGKEVPAVNRALSSVVGILQDLGNNYYASAAARREFPSQVVLLQKRHSSLAEQLKKYNQDVGPALVEAEKLMLKVVKTLEKRRARETEHTGGCQKLCGIASVATQRMAETAFPKKIGIAVGDAVRAYERIEVLLRAQRENEENIRVLASNCPTSLLFCDDNLYVPLERTESSISDAINKGKAAVPTVILLHGGPGTGKSTVSRHISLKYKSDFDHIVWLECGPSPDPISVQLKLLQSLGWSNDSSEITEESPAKWLQRGTRQSQLQNALRTQRLLIVLDDLHDAQLLQELLILSEPNVTYLVTSQRDDICDNVSHSFRSKIQIENVGDDEPYSKNISMKLLAVHSGYEDGNIPRHLQEVAEKIADKAQGIPLVIATLGAQLKNADHRDNPTVWKCLLGSPSQFLDEGMPSQNIHGVPYLKSYWSVLSHSVNSLGADEKQMLLLLGTCKDVSVPEGVVFFLFLFVQRATCCIFTR